MEKAARYLLWIGILATLATPAFAETRTISWDPVTTYTDDTPIEAGKTVTYSAYWTTDPGLGSLHTIGTSLATTSTTFDPDVQGMTRGGTVYFTAKAVLNTGEESALSPAYAWVVPLVAPPPPVLTAVTVSGPSSVNEGGTGTYTATGTWDNGTTAAISPTWSENSSYATISSGGVLTASAVTSNQSVTVTASPTAAVRATMSVTIVDVPAVLMSIAVSGPSSVNEGGTGTYTATGTWDNGTTAAISPTWSENSSYATISGGGVLTASAVTSNQSVTVTATYERPYRDDERDDRRRAGGADEHRGERSVVGERRRDRYVHGDGHVGQRDDGGDQPDVERELVVRDDQQRRRADGVRGDVEPVGDGDGDLRRRVTGDEP